MIHLSRLKARAADPVHQHVHDRRANSVECLNRAQFLGEEGLNGRVNIGEAGG